MKTIVPAQISTEIIRLINEARRYLILVSPFNDWSYWTELKDALRQVLKRSVIVCLYIKEKSYDCSKLDYWKRQGVKIFVVENLHAKLYLNEKEVIVSSMNLLKYSARNSLEIGLITETDKECKELKAYFDNHIKFQGSQFLFYSKADNTQSFSMCWFCSIHSTDMYFDW